MRNIYDIVCYNIYDIVCYNIYDIVCWTPTYTLLIACLVYVGVDVQID